MTSNHDPGAADGVNTPDDLSAIESLVGRLSDIDRARAPSGLGERVYAMSVGVLAGQAGVEALAKRAGAQARAAAGDGLEDRVFDRSLQELTGALPAPIPMRLVHERSAHGESRASRASPNAGAPGRRTRRLYRSELAAAAMLLCAGMLTIVLLRSGPSAVDTGQSAGSTLAAADLSDDELRAKLDADMETLLAAVGDAEDGALSTSVEEAFDPEWLDQLIEEGQSS